MKKVTIIFLTFFLVALISPAIHGESLQTKLVPAEAQWIIHIDIEKFAQTELKKILEKNSENDFSREIMGIERTTGIDFFSDITAVTAIGMNHNNNEPVLAFSGKLNKEHLLGLLKEEESPDEINYGNFLIYSWDNEYGVFASENLLIISENHRGLEKVLDTYSGKGKTFSGTPLQRQMRTLSPNTFLVATANNVSELVDEDNDDFGAILLSKTESAFFSAQEQNSQVRLFLSLQTDSPETATNMESMVSGLKAFLAMNEQIDPEWDIVKTLSVSKKDTAVELTAQGSVEELLHVFMGKK